jgi:arylsulfatase A-like enzyme
MDEQIAYLLDELDRRGVLDDTWVIICGDHGEGLGEHDLFEHGESLYSTEIHVPLLMIPPKSLRVGHVVEAPVTLRDLPATIVDLVGLAEGTPFPGQSLAPLWRDTTVPRSSRSDDVLSELPSPSPSDSSHGRSPARRGPLFSLASGDFVYIRNGGDGTEELYDRRSDPKELSNLTRSSEMTSTVQKFRKRLSDLRR